MRDTLFPAVDSVFFQGRHKPRLAARYLFVDSVNTQWHWAGLGLLQRLCVASRDIAITSHLDVATVDCFWLASISLASKHNLNEYI